MDEVVTAVLLNRKVVWDVWLCRLVRSSQSFEDHGTVLQNIGLLYESMS
jgi:hypothetical protein